MEAIARIVGVYLYALVASWWVYHVASAVRPGLRRLLVACPILVADFLITPMLWDHRKSPIAMTPLSGIFCLSAFKVLAFCIDRGPLLESGIRQSFFPFAAIMCLPVIPNSVFKLSGGSKMEGIDSPLALLSRYLKQIGGAGVVAVINFSTNAWLPVLCRHWLYALSTCLFLGAVMDLLGALASSMFGIQIAPTFNQPWLSSSFADFWARRWNLTTTYMLRVLVYEPIIEGSLVPLPPTPKTPSPTPPNTTDPIPNPTAPAATPPLSPSGSSSDSLHLATPPSPTAPTPTPAAPSPPSRTFAARPPALRQYLALQATFLFSAVWHIYIFWCNTHEISWRWFIFFTIQAPILVVEKAMVRLARRRGLVLPRLLSIPLANFLLIYLARPIFFGPVDNSGMADRIRDSLKPTFDSIAERVRS